MPERPIELSDFETNLDKLSVAHSPRIIVAWVDTSSEEEEEMALNLRRGLKDLVAGRNKGLSSKEAAQTQLPPNLPLPPFPSPPGLLLDPNLQKKNRKEKDIDEGENVPPKQQKTAKDKRASSVDSREDLLGVEVLRQQRIWAPRLELEGDAIPWDASVREF